MLALLLASVWCLLVSAQDKTVPVCSEGNWAALKQLPRLEYTCSETLTESDSRILSLPRRRAALARVMETLRSYTNPAWWEAKVNELSACELKGGAGELSDEEKERWRSGDYSFLLFGDNQTRLVLISDPCFQTGYNGSNAFVLHRQEGRVFVTQVLDGYYSRAANSVGIDFANLNGRRIVEVATGNSMPPSLVSYFFTIDQSGRAVPRRIFRAAGRLTNEIYSAMLMGEPAQFRLPTAATELNIIRDGKLAQRFSAYEENERGRIDADGRKLRRVVYRWNGRFYLPTN